MGFWESIAGRTFTEGTVPKLVKEIKRLNDTFEKVHERNEKEYKEVSESLAKVMSMRTTREEALEAVVHELLTQIFDGEIAGHIKHETLVIACQVSDFEYLPPHRRNSTGETDEDKDSSSD